MKKLLLICLLFISYFGYSQNVEYPRIEKDSLGNTVVVITIEQAQKIDNNMDLLKLMEKAGLQSDNVNSAYIKVIDGLNNQIKLLIINVDNLKKQNKDKDDQIVDLQKQLSNEKTINSLCETQKSNDKKEIDNLKGEVTKLKTQKWIGFIAGSAAVVAGLLSYLHIIR